MADDVRLSPLDDRIRRLTSVRAFQGETVQHLSVRHLTPNKSKSRDQDDDDDVLTLGLAGLIVLVGVITSRRHERASRLAKVGTV